MAAETGIAPQYLMEDTRMLRALVLVLQDRAREAEKARKR